MFPIEGQSNVYQLTNDVFEHIYNNMPHDDDSDQGSSMLHETQT